MGKTVTLQSRANEYKTDFRASGNQFLCKSCNVHVDWKKKSVVDDHLKCNTHLENSRKRKFEQTYSVPQTIEESFNHASSAKHARTDTTLSLVRAFTSANIPLEKFDNPMLREFIKTKVEGGGTIPNANHLRSDYLPKIQESEIKHLKAHFQNSPIAVICDESPDHDQPVINVIFAKLKFGYATQFKLVDVVFPEDQRVNATTVTQVVIKALSDFEVNPNNVHAFVTDNAAYNHAAFRSLKLYLPYAIHVYMSHVMPISLS